VIRGAAINVPVGVNTIAPISYASLTEFGITDHGLRDYLHYNSWEMPYHPQYHYFCDDLDLRDIMDFRD